MKDEFKIIQALEESIAVGPARYDLQLLDSLLAEGFEEVGKSGRKYSRQDVLQSVPQHAADTAQLSNFRFQALLLQ